MKATELMVGNIVKHPEGYTMTVFGIKGGYATGVINVNDTLYDSQQKIKNLSPIPITEELLVKNGFKSCSEVSFIREPIEFYEIKVGDKRCLIQTTMHNGVWFFGILENGMNLAQAFITHLHQLQNLLNIMDIKLDFVV